MLHCQKVKLFHYKKINERNIIRFHSNIPLTLAKHDFDYDRDTGIISLLKGKIPYYQSIIGLEIHAQLSSSTKLFTSSPTRHSNQYQTQPNSNLQPYDIAYPGTLPQLPSKSILNKTIKTCAALNCSIQSISRFERKHYFYADLPHGYQITQQRWPIAKNGFLKLDNQKIGIERIQLEQDSGKTLSKHYHSFIDFNRAGSALIEIVFRPDIRSANDAAKTLSELQAILRYIDSCDGKMENGSLRCDLNVSIAPYPLSTTYIKDSDNPFQSYLPQGTGNRVEVKNLNSMKQVIAATEYEALRQAQYRYQNCIMEQETRTFDTNTNKTILIRQKGDAVDYRFLPEPNLPPLILQKQTISQIIQTLPELPTQAYQRIISQYNIPEDAAHILTNDKLLLTLFESSVKVAMQAINQKTIASTVANWICNDYISILPPLSSITSLSITPQQLGQLIIMIHDETISKRTAKQILIHMHKNTSTTFPQDIANEKGWNIISDPSLLQQFSTDAILNNPKQWLQYKKGGKHIWKMEKFFIGKAMQLSGGNAHPEKLKDILIATLQQKMNDEK